MLLLTWAMEKRLRISKHSNSQVGRGDEFCCAGSPPNVLGVAPLQGLRINQQWGRANDNAAPTRTDARTRSKTGLHDCYKSHVRLLNVMSPAQEPS